MERNFPNNPALSVMQRAGSLECMAAHQLPSRMMAQYLKQAHGRGRKKKKNNVYGLFFLPPQGFMSRLGSCVALPRVDSWLLPPASRTGTISVAAQLFRRAGSTYPPALPAVCWEETCLCCGNILDNVCCGLFWNDVPWWKWGTFERVNRCYTVTKIW